MKRLLALLILLPLAALAQGNGPGPALTPASIIPTNSGTDGQVLTKSGAKAKWSTVSGGGSSGVTSFNSRTGAVTLGYSDLPAASKVWTNDSGVLQPILSPPGITIDVSDTAEYVRWIQTPDGGADHSGYFDVNTTIFDAEQWLDFYRNTTNGLAEFYYEINGAGDSSLYLKSRGTKTFQISANGTAVFGNEGSTYFSVESNHFTAVREGMGTILEYYWDNVLGVPQLYLYNGSFQTFLSPTNGMSAGKVLTVTEDGGYTAWRDASGGGTDPLVLNDGVVVTNSTTGQWTKHRADGIDVESADGVSYGGIYQDSSRTYIYLADTNGDTLFWGPNNKMENGKFLGVSGNRAMWMEPGGSQAWTNDGTLVSLVDPTGTVVVGPPASHGSMRFFSDDTISSIYANPKVDGFGYGVIDIKTYSNLGSYLDHYDDDFEVYWDKTGLYVLGNATTNNLPGYWIGDNYGAAIPGITTNKNGFDVRGGIVIGASEAGGGSQVWTNDGTFIIPSGSTANSDAPVQIRSDGGLFIGPNVYQDAAAANTNISFPLYHLSMSDSNEPSIFNFSFGVVDSENFGHWSQVFISGNSPDPTNGASTLYGAWSVSDATNGLSGMQLNVDPATNSGGTRLQLRDKGNVFFLASPSGITAPAFVGDGSGLTNLPSGGGSQVWTNDGTKIFPSNSSPDGYLPGDEPRTPNPLNPIHMLLRVGPDEQKGVLDINISTNQEESYIDFYHRNDALGGTSEFIIYWDATGPVLSMSDTNSHEVFNASHGNITHSGTVNGVKVYRALLTETPPATLTNGTLSIGTRYTITTHLGADDFTNVGADANDDGTIFIATGTTPAAWADSSVLNSDGAPVATVLENTLGGTLVWGRASAGNYTATLAGAFPAGKVLVFPGNSGSINFGQRGDDNTIQLVTLHDADDSGQDYWLVNTSFEILVYP